MTNLGLLRCQVAWRAAEVGQELFWLQFDGEPKVGYFHVHVFIEQDVFRLFSEQTNHLDDRYLQQISEIGITYFEITMHDVHVV